MKILPHKKKVEQLTVEERRRQVARLSLDGWNQTELAKRFGVSQVMICKDLKVIRQRWIEEGKADYDTAKAEELAKIRHLVRICYEGWERSCQDAEVDVEKVEEALREVQGVEKRNGRVGTRSVLPSPNELVPVKRVKEKRRTGQAGNPVFLNIIRGCLELEAKLLGLLQDVNINVNPQGGGMNWGPESCLPPADSPVVDPMMTLPPKIVEAESVATVQQLPAPNGEHCNGDGHA